MRQIFYGESILVHASSPRRCFVIVISMLMAVINFGQPHLVHAAGLVVTSTADAGAGSLRQTILDAAPGDTITFAPNVTGIIQLVGATSSIVLNKNLTIAGPGADLLAIQGDPADRIFRATAGDIGISGLSLQHASSTANPYGAAIYIDSGVSVTLARSTVKDHTGIFGSALYNNGVLRIQQSLFTGNRACVGCGTSVIQNESGAQLNISGSTFRDNPAAPGTPMNVTVIDNHYGTVVINSSVFLNNGGAALRTGGYTSTGINATISNSTFSGNGFVALWNSGSRVNITQSTFDSNYAPSLAGGAIYINSGTVNADQTTFSNNTSSQDGGAIGLTSGGTVNLTNSTITGNSASNRGGAIYANYGYANLLNSTIANNTAAQGGGFNFVVGSGSRLTVANSIVANNTGYNCVGIAPGNNGHNLQYGDATCGADIQNADPKLQPLSNNGGSTQTLALGDQSAAIDQGDNSLCATAPVYARDQRGMMRPVGSSCDIGAYEVQLVVSNTITPTATDTSVPTSTNTAAPTASNTPLPTSTETEVPTASNTPLPTVTSTPVPTDLPTSTNTALPTITNTPLPTSTNTALPTTTNTPRPSATNTALPTTTNTPLPSATNTPLPTITRIPPTSTPIPPSNTPLPTKTKTQTPTPRPTTAVPPTSIPAAAIRVQIQNGGNDSTQQAQFRFKIINSGGTSQNGLSVRIYITLDNNQPISSYVLEKYWDQSGAALISAPVAVSATTYYYTVSYPNALPANGSWEFHAGLHLSDWSNNFSGLNDAWHSGYAQGALPGIYTDTPNIPAYVNTERVWGTTP